MRAQVREGLGGQRIVVGALRGCGSQRGFLEEAAPAVPFEEQGLLGNWLEEDSSPKGNYGNWPSGPAEEGGWSGQEPLDPDLMAFLLLRLPTPGHPIQPGDQARANGVIRILLLWPRNPGREHTGQGFRHTWSQANASSMNLHKAEESWLGLSFPTYKMGPRTLSSLDCWEAHSVDLWIHVSKESPYRYRFPGSGRKCAQLGFS